LHLAGRLSIFKHLAVEIARLTGLFFLESEEMTEILEKMKELLLPILAQHQAFLVDLAVKGERGGKLVQAFIDTDPGIAIEACAEISRELAQELDRAEIIQGSYRLEVSSPGIDKPLRLLRQYRKNVGRLFRVTHQSGSAQASFVGKLLAVEEESLKFENEAGESVTLEFIKIVESKEELPW
jgi:ribosome maturation factor RimP